MAVYRHSSPSTPGCLPSLPSQSACPCISNNADGVGLADLRHPHSASILGRGLQRSSALEDSTNERDRCSRSQPWLDQRSRLACMDGQGVHDEPQPGRVYFDFVRLIDLARISCPCPAWMMGTICAIPSTITAIRAARRRETRRCARHREFQSKAAAHTSCHHPLEPMLESASLHKSAELFGSAASTSQGLGYWWLSAMCQCAYGWSRGGVESRPRTRHQAGQSTPLSSAFGGTGAGPERRSAY